MNREEKFWNRMADGYSKSKISDEDSYQKKLKISQSYFKPDMEVLEFGCGTGSTALIHAPFVQHIRATDISQRMLEIAQKKADAQGIKNVTFERTTVEDLNVNAQSLDAVLGLSILHLLEDKDTAITKVYDMLKPDGLFITSTVCLGDGSMKYLKVPLILGRCFRLLPLVKFFKGKELEQSIINAGFEIEHYWRPGPKKAVFIVARKPSK